MESGTPKIRFGIAPGTSARDAEQERAGTLPQMHIRGGTAARMAEAEAPVAPQRPYSISMRAQSGRPFTLSGSSVAEASPAKPQNVQPKPDIRTESFRPLIQQGEISAPAAGRVERDFPAGKDESGALGNSPLQVLRNLFSRKSPKTATTTNKQSSDQAKRLNAKRSEGESRGQSI